MSIARPAEDSSGSIRNIVPDALAGGAGNGRSCPGPKMDDKIGLFQLLNELAITHPALVLMRGRRYYRIEDLLKWARKDRVSGTPEDKETLSRPAYWHTRDVHGKILIKTVGEGHEFVAYVEPGSDVPTDLE